MTLIITLIRPEGIWQSADNRTTIGKRIYDDETPKQLHIICPPLPGGPQILLGFTGLAKLSDGTPMVQWLRETLRGEPRLIMPMFDYLRDRLMRDVGGSIYWDNILVFSGGIFEGDKRFYFELHNVDPATRKPTRKFAYAVNEVTDQLVAIAGSGTNYITYADRKLLDDQAKVKPSKWEDHLGLLAAVNRRAALRDPNHSVSPWCSASYISHDREELLCQVPKAHQVASQDKEHEARSKGKTLK